MPLRSTVTGDNTGVVTLLRESEWAETVDFYPAKDVIEFYAEDISYEKMEEIQRAGWKFENHKTYRPFYGWFRLERE